MYKNIKLWVERTSENNKKQLYKWWKNPKIFRRRTKFVRIKDWYNKVYFKRKYRVKWRIFLSTPLRIAIFYYINLIKEVLECITILNLKTKKEFFNEVLGNSKTAEIIGNGYLRGHRVINFTFIEKIILRYKNELPENKIKNLYRFLFLHDSIMAFIQENYSYEKIIYFNQEYIKNLFSQGLNISDMKPQNIKKKNM